MEEIGKRLPYPRIRSRVIDVLESGASGEATERFGASGTIDMVDDWLPTRSGEPLQVFNEKAQAILHAFLQAMNRAAASMAENWGAARLRASKEWARMREVAQEALGVFMERGRFSDDVEEIHPTE